MRINRHVISAIGGAIAGAATAWAIYERKQRVDLADKLDTSIKALADSTAIDIPGNLIQDAVDAHVERYVKDALQSASELAVKAVKDDIHTSVASAVAVEKQKFSEPIKVALEEKVAQINVDKLKSDVMKEVTKKFINELDDDMRDVMHSIEKKGYNRLDEVNRRYERRLEDELDRVRHKTPLFVIGGGKE